jgi:hypothetical protein
VPTSGEVGLSDKEWSHMLPQMHEKKPNCMGINVGTTAQQTRETILKGK